jgi:hypothetical protein
MADGISYGINFPFRNSLKGDYLQVTEFEKDEVRAALLHLILTRKGARYYLPNFGTRIYEFIFEPLDNLTFDAIQSDIRDAINAYMPNLIVNSITIEPASVEDEASVSTNVNSTPDDVPNVFRVPGKGTADYTAKIKIEYQTDSATFAQSDFVIINI